MLIRVVAPHFVAGYDRSANRIAPIIKYMLGWSVRKIQLYCHKKGWECQLL